MCLRQVVWRGSASRLQIGLPRDLTQETIASPRNRLDELGAVCRVSQGLAQLIHRRIKAVIKIYEGVGGPKSSPQSFASDDGTRCFQQGDQNREWLLLDAQISALPAKFPGLQIGLKYTEVCYPRFSVCQHAVSLAEGVLPADNPLLSHKIKGGSLLDDI